MRIRQVLSITTEPEEEMPIGGLLFGDPSTAGLTEQIHKFDHPRNVNQGPKKPVGVRTMTNTLDQYRNRTSAGAVVHKAWENSHKVRGIPEIEEGEE